MATDTDHRAYCSHLRHLSGFSSDPQYEIQDVSISELVNHGSISFGRFAVETLEWEKRSVFSHNRYQEELEKFKAPGIVAQKKAYFEEYYRKIRAAKKLQSEEQEISQSDPCEDKLSCTSQAQSSPEICNSNEVKNSDGTSPIAISVEKMSGHQDIIAESNKGKSLVTGIQKDNYKGGVIKGVQKSNNTLHSRGGQCLEKAAKIPASSAKTYSKSSIPNRGHQDIIAESNKGKSLVTGIQKDNYKGGVIKGVQKSNNTLHSAGGQCLEKAAKIPASSAKTYSKSSIPNRGVSVSQNLNANKLKARTLPFEVKGTVPLPKVERMVNNRTRRDAAKLPDKGKEVTGDDGTGSRRSVMGEKAARLLQRDVKCQNIEVHKNPTRDQSSTKVPQAEVSRHIPATCSNTKINLDKANSKFGLKNKTTSRHANVTNRVNNLSVERPSAGVPGRTLQSSSRNMTQRSGQSENQKPKIISINRQTETNPNIRVGTQMKETRAVNGRVPNTATKSSSSSNKAASPKLEKMVMSRVKCQFSAPTSGGREQRNKLPSWR